MNHSCSPVISPVSGILEKWWRSSEKRKNFVKAKDKIVTIRVQHTDERIELTSKVSGTVESCLFPEGAFIEAETVVAFVRPCPHPAMFQSMCVACGDTVVRDLGIKSNSTANFPPSTSSTLSNFSGGKPIFVSREEAARLQDAKVSGLRASKKLALVLDLDHTLIHATECRKPPTELDIRRGIKTISIEESSGFGHRLYSIKLRPHIHEFLLAANELCQLSIYTAGTRKYAEAIAKLIETECGKKLFQGRIVSRSDHKGTLDDAVPIVCEKSLERIFLGDPSLAVIIDDREDVWRGYQVDHLLLVRPYHFFTEGPEVNNQSGQSSAIMNIALSGPTPGTRIVPNLLNNAKLQTQSLKIITENIQDLKSSSIDMSSEISVLSSAENDSLPSITESESEVDDQLIRSLEIIKSIHQRIYSPSSSSSPSSTSKITSVPSAIRHMKANILAGCVVTFSGIIPVGFVNPQLHLLSMLCTSMGAQLSFELTPQTTHLICANTNTSKVGECKVRGNVWIVHPDWLIYCRWALAKVTEVTFSLVAVNLDAPPNPVFVLTEIPVLSSLAPPLPPSSFSSSTCNEFACEDASSGSKKRNRAVMFAGTEEASYAESSHAKHRMRPDMDEIIETNTTSLNTAMVADDDDDDDNDVYLGEDFNDDDQLLQQTEEDDFEGEDFQNSCNTNDSSNNSEDEDDDNWDDFDLALKQRMGGV